MTVRVYFREKADPLDYTSVRVVHEGGSRDLNEGSVTCHNWGVHVKASKDDHEYLYPWTAVREVILGTK